MWSDPLSEARVLEPAAGGVLVASWRGVFINVWNRTATVPTLRRLGALTDSMRAEHPGGFVTIAIIPTHLALTPADARKEAEVVTARAAGCTHALAYVFEGTGFGAAATRALVTGVMLIQRQRIPSRVFDRIEPACEWLLPRRPAGAPAADPAALGTLLLALRVRG